MTDEGGTRRIGPLRLPRRVARISWRDLLASLGPILLVSGVAIWVAVHFVRPAPPGTIVITAGPEGSIGQITAERYRKILARSGEKLEILASAGSLENLKRLADPAFRVDVGFVQGGLSTLVDTSGLVSLGSVFYEPMLVFYRAPESIGRLSALKGRRIAVGPEGSGTRILALALLKANGVDAAGPTRLLDLGGKAAAEALRKREVDAAFLTSDLAPTVELIARPDLHPALSDLLIEAARQVHGRTTLFQRAGEFPAPLEHEYRISDDAARYYKSGKGFVYRHLPFWLASLVDRAAVVLVPIIVVLIPGMRLAPTIYGWRLKTRIYRRYGELMALERAALAQPSAEERVELLERLGEIEKSVITTKMPGSVADQIYVLRRHIDWVRERLGGNATSGPAGTSESLDVPLLEAPRGPGA
jgi:hypothetical protein